MTEEEKRDWEKLDEAIVKSAKSRLELLARMKDVTAIREQIKQNPEGYANPKKVKCILDKLIKDVIKVKEE